MSTESRSAEPPSMLPLPSFAAFYRSINGRDPFPWQARLARQIAETGEWPAEVGVPTGLGKTACLDVAVWWLASQATRPPAQRTAPTRIWWVVNRRLLVDSTAEHAHKIAETLANPTGRGLEGRSAEDVAAVAARLRRLSSDPEAAPLEVIRLRGGIEWRRPTDPSRPAVLLSTLPMYGSRLLFRGYGSSRGMRPIDAALAGIDSLVLLDEAHLAPHLRTVISALAQCGPGARTILGEARCHPRLVELTATGDAAAGARFDLDADDEAHHIVRERLDAAKPTELRTFDTADLGKHLAEAARDLLRDASDPAACVVFANTPKTARSAFDLLRKLIPGDSADLILLTGRSREHDAEAIRTRILDPGQGMAASRDPAVRRERHLIVIATQTLEVGADVDAEYLVSEACGVRALTQRLGRLNRLGRHVQARAIYIHGEPKTKGKKREDADEWPVYGREPKVVLDRITAALNDLRAATLNLSPRRIAGILGGPREDSGRAPEILPGLLWEWIKTTTPPRDEAPVEPYFSGIAGPEYSVTVIWRAHVPGGGERLWPRARDREAVEVPIRDAREAFGADPALMRLTSDRVTVEEIKPNDLRPGDSVVVPCDRGLLDEFGWNPSSDAAVVDVSLRERGLPLDATAIRRLCGVSLGGLLGRALGSGEDHEDIDPSERAEAIDRILTFLVSATGHGWDPGEWNAFVVGLERRVVDPPNEVPRLRLKAELGKSESRSDERDEMSLTEAATELEPHGRAVAARARQIAVGLGLAIEFAEAVESGGLFHDAGKADRRFQRWLDPGGDHTGRLLAKSNMPPDRWEAARAHSGWPKGGRHEALSARLVERMMELSPGWDDRELRDLVLHLVISHHGHGRPLVRPIEDGTAMSVSALINGKSVEASADLASVDWAQPARFRRLNDRLGPWGLALLEAIVRQADHAISSGASADPPSVGS